MGDRKPSQFLRRLKSLAPDIPDYFLWPSRLPAKIQTTLAGMPEIGLDAAALCADLITEAISPSTIAIISQRPNSTELLQCIGVGKPLSQSRSFRTQNSRLPWFDNPTIGPHIFS
jgi:hypothetical protein